MIKSRDLTPTFVLHRRSYSDNSLLLDCFTLRHGRLSCIARGAKSGKSPRAALLQPFNALVAGYSGRGEVKTLTQCEAVDTPPRLEGERLYSGFYLNELLQQFLQREEPHEAVFAHYANTLVALADTAPVESLLRQFECALLHELGYGLQLTHEVNTAAPLQADRLYSYQPEHGPVLCADNLTAGNAMPTVSGATLMALQHGEFSSSGQVREAKLLMRFLISRLLGGYNFKSREFFQPGPRSNEHEQPL